MEKKPQGQGFAVGKSGAIDEEGSSKTLISNPNGGEIGFQFEVKVTESLKLALEEVCDPEFNRSMVGRFDVDRKGLRITVGNSSDGHLCLWLKPPNLQNSEFNHLMFGVSVNLRNMSDNLGIFNGKDAVIVAHIVGSNDIAFSFGEEAFTIELLENTVPVPEFPHAPFRPFLFSILSTENIQLGNDLAPSLSSENEDMGFDGISGLGGGGDIDLLFPEELKKADRLCHVFQLSDASLPPESVMLHFNLQHLGDLTFLQETASPSEENDNDDKLKFACRVKSPWEGHVNHKFNTSGHRGLGLASTPYDWKN